MYAVSPRIIGVLVVVLSLGLAAPALALDRLPSDSHVDYQLGGAAPVLPGVGVVVRDRTDAPAPGMANVCYVNGFQTQPNERSFWRAPQRWGLVLKRRGRPVVDAQWGEWLLDIRTPRKRRALAAIMGRWIEGCALKGFVAVEFDNLDSFTRSRRLLKRRHAIAFARLLVQRAHRVGLLAGQKNLADFNGTRIGYDFAVAEECGHWDECGRYLASYGDQVLAIEYSTADFARTCAGFGASWPVVRHERALSPSGVREFC
ncbi:MAG TPA: endo alpha-1,4 polygalactosaminidase [Marmoricola sp.]|nr:endo alpha-1,4 polygalactosaminidase [Marmoricola sp.]HNI71186.1 endo alpha-1,4 polygalactosaminidase [Marmoricola sp.]